MSKSDNKTQIRTELITQSDEVEEREPNPLILRSCDSDASEDLSLNIVEISTVNACSNVNSNGISSSSLLDSEVIITDVKNGKTTKGIMGAQNDVEDTERKEENGTLLEIDNVEKSDNVVLRKLLRGPRYFDSSDNSWGNCYKCGEAGHTGASCTPAKRRRPCFVCGSFEHNAKQCKQGKDCFICKKVGHRAKNCPEKSTESIQKAKLCLKCGDLGHEMFTCQTVYSLDDLKKVQCYICKCFGHLCCFDYGKGQNEVSCYKCGQLGHFGLECANASSSSRTYEEKTNTSSPRSCYKCGEEGHKARKCKSSTKKRKRKSEFSGPNNSHSKDNRDHIGARSAPHDQVEGRKRNKTHHGGHSNSSQSKRRGGWINEDHAEHYGGKFHVNNWGSPRTPPIYRSNNSFNGNYGVNGYGSGFHHEGSGSNGYQHRFTASRFGNSSNIGRREYGWDY